MTLQEDRELVVRCLAGSQDAWGMLYRRLYITIHRIPLWKTWGFSQQQAEEIIQETFVAIVAALETFHFDSSLETFAATIAKKRCISEVRKLTALKRQGEGGTVYFEDTHNDYEIAAVESYPAFFDDNLERDEVKQQLQAALGEMDEACRKLLRRKYYDNESYEEIGRRFKIPRGTVSSRLSRCLLKLRKLCDHYLEDWCENKMQPS
ncbi:MAG: sigma-70 family RNA polymerase sigma factor [Deltaproteobacteria bacterium]|nr:sigma-70 family RNA polymerase sigma factor [Deltaproteobacteria bacterium]